MEWMENLSDEWKDNEMLKQYDSLDSALTGFKETKAAASNSIRIYGPDASDEDKAANYQKVMKHYPQLVMKPNPDSAEQTAEYHRMLGVPEDAEGDGGGRSRLWSYGRTWR